jgi:hypothetical protein
MECSEQSKRTIPSKFGTLGRLHLTPCVCHFCPACAFAGTYVEVKK